MDLRLPAPSLVVLVGPSGSGKSTWAAGHFAAAEIVSSDALRGVVGAGEDDQTAGAAAFDLLERIVTERMRRGLTTVIDTLGLDSESRRRWVALAHSAGVTAHCVVFDTTAQVCLERNEARPRPVPKSIIEKQVRRFAREQDTLDGDGFDGIHRQQPITVVSAPVAAAETARPGRDRSPTGHTFGLMVSRFDWADADIGATLASIAQRAEGAGFRDLWLMDHFRQIRGVGRPWEDIPEAYVSLGYLAGLTEKIRLGAMVTGITHRQPVVLGKMVATLDVLSGGRANCGLGAAWDSAEHAAYGIDFPGVPVRYELLEETLQMLPLLWGKGSPEFRGRHIDAGELMCYPRPVQERIPIVIGGSGERRTLRLVAAYADACNLFGDPDTVAGKVAVIEEHCRELDRDPAGIEVTHLTTALVAGDRAALRTRVEALRDRNTTAERYMARVGAGTVEDLVALFTAYDDAGASHSVVTLPDVAEEGSIETFADVIDRFHSP